MSELQALGIECVGLDVTSAASITALVDTLSSVQPYHGPLHIDALINNAGRSYLMPAADCDMAEVQATFDTNVFGAMRMVQAFLPLLISSGDGIIINIGSVSATVSFPFGSTYSASKAALLAYSDTLRVELKPVGVRVVTVLASAVKSKLSSHVWAAPEESVWKSCFDKFIATIAPRAAVATNTAQFFNQIADLITSRRTRRNPPAHFWAGKYATVILVLNWLTCGKFWHYPMSRDLGLDKIKV
ncbi:NAD(P)-binding protein [Auricularia subglabra TFB-10046 SS5]|uniref:NAD(P)-binding protein n=1 Tax=Auricularia subglabra (strain TFB-10046 / SS5) TaxID=717982 RepID=J0WTN8_AURST|nr:NAD(P)-binding protein [Auricularia subglabra TFB-10046 SS5]